MLAQAGFWFSAVFGAPAAALTLDLAIMIFQRQFNPRPSQILQVGGLFCPFLSFFWQSCDAVHRTAVTGFNFNQNRAVL
jgi:hypothetical protein